MEELCSYGCGNIAVTQFKNGKYCCSSSQNKCPVMIKKNSEGQKNNNGGAWNKGLTKETDERVKKYSVSGSISRKKQVEDGTYVVWNKGLDRTDPRVFNNIKDLSKNRQGYYHTLNYFKDKYGDVLGNEKYLELNIKKKINLVNFMIKYGDELGDIKYCEYINGKKPYYSKISQELFLSIDLGDSYFAVKNKEFGLKDIDKKRYYYYDFVDTKRKKVIEFNGDDFHANPKLYKEDSIPLNFINKTAKEIWENDKIKHNRILQEGYELLIIWESDYKLNKKKMINKCITFLKN